jgi:hypothetical protein
MAIRWRDGPEAKAVRVGQCYRMERMLRCLDLGTIASEVCPGGSSEDFQHVLVLISRRFDPFRNLGELVIPGPVKISGSIYPKSISFYCNNGDPAATPAYKLRRNARRFKATIGLEAKCPPFPSGRITSWRWAHSPDF